MIYGRLEILASIHPKYAEAILDGRKSIEYRKNIPIHERLNIWRMWIYETAPISKIVGVTLVEIWQGGVFDEKRGMLTREEYRRYMGGDVGYGIHIFSATRFHNPMTLEDIGLKRPPQSWMYMPEGFNPPNGTTVFNQW